MGRETAHLIIETDATYFGAGEFAWSGVRRVDPETVCLADEGDIE